MQEKFRSDLSVYFGEFCFYIKGSISNTWESVIVFLKMLKITNCCLTAY